MFIDSVKHDIEASSNFSFRFKQVSTFHNVQPQKKNEILLKKSFIQYARGCLTHFFYVISYRTDTICLLYLIRLFNVIFFSSSKLGPVYLKGALDKTRRLYVNPELTVIRLFADNNVTVVDNILLFCSLTLLRYLGLMCCEDRTSIDNMENTLALSCIQKHTSGLCKTFKNS